MCWLIKYIKNKYCVGYFAPEGWYTYEECDEKTEAEDLCNYLNGGG